MDTVRPFCDRRFANSLVFMLALVALLFTFGGVAAVAQNPLPSGASEEGAAQEQGTSKEESFEAPQVETLIPEKPLEISSWASVGKRLFERFVDALPDIVYALVVLGVFFLLYLVLKRILTSVMRRRRSDPALREILTKLLKYALIVIAVIMAAGQLGFHVGTLLASAGVIGLAIGLAAQDSLSNIVAGLILLWDEPFRTGDNVTIADIFGEVQHVGLRATHLRSPEELDIYIPNRQVMDEEIINHTQSPGLRLDVPVGIAYEEDIREARQVLLDVVDGHELVAEDPPPEVVVTALGDSAVTLELRAWMKDPKRERRGMVTLLEECKLALDDAGIDMPYPQRTLHLANEELVTHFQPQRQAS